MDSAMCLRCEVVVATVSHSQFHSYSQPTSPKFSHGFCFYFCNIFFYTFFGLCGAHAMPEKKNYIQHCSVFNHPRFCASEGITPTSSTMKMFAFGRSRWLSKSFYVHKFKFFHFIFIFYTATLASTLFLLLQLLLSLFFLYCCCCFISFTLSLEWYIRLRGPLFVKALKVF